MNREEFATKVQDLVNQAYLHDIDNKYYKGMMYEAEKLRYPITLAEFLGWEEGIQYRRGENIFKVEGNRLLLKKPSGMFYSIDCSTTELIDLRSATKYEPKYYAKIKGWELIENSQYMYWTVDSVERDVFIGVASSYPRYHVSLTKKEWSELGITDKNADFEEAGRD